jgi:glycosyltransferase involved in cell wall biosynthesis
MIHLYKNYKDRLHIYKQEADYYNPMWNQFNNFDQLYPKEYLDMYYQIEEYNHEYDKDKIDIIYNITYPYNISITKVPKIVFFTSEFSKLTKSYFNEQLENIEDTNMFFITPSAWSNKGINTEIENRRFKVKTRTITHGVDCNIFKRKDSHEISKARKKYNISEDDILLGNFGSMTENKGMHHILLTLKILVIDKNMTQFKLLLKGTKDLYTSKEFLNLYLQRLSIPESLSRNIIFMDNTLSANGMALLYNCLDLYFSPYIAEGFNLGPLESLACGTRALLPITGSTVEYSRLIQDSAHNSEDQLILYVPSVVREAPGQLQMNVIDIYDIVNVIIKYTDTISRPINNITMMNMRNIIRKNLSWDYVSDRLYDYIKECVENQVF